MATSTVLPFEPPLDELSQLQLRVARRADEIAWASRLASGLNLHCWLLAEAEVWRSPEVATGLGCAALMLPPAS